MDLTSGVRLFAPEAFLLLWVVPIVTLLFVLAGILRRRSLRTFVGQCLMPDPDQWNTRLLKSSLMISALFMIIVALARPGWTPETRIVERHGRDVVFVVDVSRSMLAQDLSPSRLERAKIAIQDMLEVLSGERIALVAFAGSAVVKSPLTFDYGFVRFAVDRLSVESTARGGTMIGDALRVVRDSIFERKRNPFRDIVLITDGGDLGSLPEHIASELGELGARLIVVGLGDDRNGQPIPSPDSNGGFLTYDGEPVLTMLEADGLRKLAAATPGGRYVNVATGNFDLGDLYAQLIVSAERRLIETTEREVVPERFQLFLIVALILLALEFVIPDLARRQSRGQRHQRTIRLPVSLLTLCVLSVAAFVSDPGGVYAAGIAEQAERNGFQAYAEERFLDAAEAFGIAASKRTGAIELSYDTGIAFYRAGNMDAAAELLRQAVQEAHSSEIQTAGHFAMGNVAARAVVEAMTSEGAAAIGDPQAALDSLKSAAQSYRRALDLDPLFSDAAHNLEVTRLRMQELFEQFPPLEDPSADSAASKEPEKRQDEPNNLSDGEQQYLNDEGATTQRQLSSSYNQQDQKMPRDDFPDQIISEEEERADQASMDQIQSKLVERDW